MKKIEFALWSILFLGCSNVSKKDNGKISIESQIDAISNDNTDGNIRIDVSKKYDEKKISIQNISNISYISLETNDDFLWRGNVKGITESYILGGDNKTGDILLFDRNGKSVKKINHKGNGAQEYTSFITIVPDEDNAEIFVNDNFKKKIFVYDFDGTYKRVLNYPSGGMFYRIYDFDDKYLIGYDKRNNEILNKFVIFSKQNGSVKKEITLSQKVKISERFRYKSKNGGMVVVATEIYPLMKSGNDFVLSDISCDTIYKMNKNMEYAPYIVRDPSICNMEKSAFLFYILETDQYLFANTVTKEFDMDKQEGYPSVSLMYDKKIKQIYEVHFYNSDYINMKELEIGREAISFFSVLDNVCVVRLDPISLIDDYENGNLKGELKKIASTLKEDDNDVLMVIRFK